MNKPTCTIPECVKPHRARGLCTTHYNNAHQPNRHAKKTGECAWCGVEVTRSTGGGRKYGMSCSSQCSEYLARPYCKLPADHWALWFGQTSQWKPPPKVPARFTANTCDECGLSFIDAHAGTPSSYCSRACQRRVTKRARSAREHESTGTFRWIEVIRLWMAAGKRCGYCDKAMATQPDPDHVIPISRGGHNDLGNILPVCHMCNADKGDLTLEEWRESREQRQLEPRRYVLDPAEARYNHLVLGVATGSAWRHRQAA